MRNIILLLLLLPGYLAAQNTISAKNVVADEKLRAGRDTSKYWRTISDTINASSTHRQGTTAKAVYNYVNPLRITTGDVTGTLPALTVDGLQGRTVLSTAPTTGQVLKWNGTAWGPDDPGGAGIDTLATYTALRAYTGASKVVFVKDFAIATADTIRGGFFFLAPSGTENYGTLIAGAGGRKWKRDFDGALKADWFEIALHNKRIMTSMRVGGYGSTTELEKNKTYTMYGEIFLDSLQNIRLKGNYATIKRANESNFYTTLSASYSGGYSIQVAAVPSGWEVGDAILLATGSSNDSISQSTSIASIVGTTINLNFPINAQPGGIFSAPSGTRVYENFNLLRGRPSETEGVAGPRGVNRNTIIEQVIFDGNKSSHTFLKGWTTNPAMTLHGIGSVIRNCEFKNHPAEVINGFGLNVHDNYIHDNGGSAFHLSGHDVTIASTISNAFTNNVVERTNQVARSINGHNEGAISFSWNGGSLHVIGNYFKDGLTGIIGTITGTGTANDREDVIVSNNRCYNFYNIAYTIDGSSQPVVISDNIFYNCGSTTNNYAPYTSVPWRVCNNVLMDGTIISLPTNMRCDPAASLPNGVAGDVIVHDGSGWTATGQSTLENDNVNYWNKSGANLNYTAGKVLVGTTAVSQAATTATNVAIDGGLSVKFAATQADTSGSISMVVGPSSASPMETGGTAATPATVWYQNGYNATLDAPGGTLLFRQARANGSRQSIVFLGGTAATTKALEIRPDAAIRFGGLSGTGNRLAVLNSSGDITRGTFDPANLLSGSGTANYVTYWSGTSAMTGSANFVFNGTNASLGGVATPEQRLDVNGGIQTRFASIDPNTTNGYLYLGTANTILSSKSGSMIAPLTAYNATLNRSLRTLVIQGASDGLGEGISFVTGGTPAERLNISVSGAYTFNTLTGTGNRLPVLSSSGVMTRSSYDPATFLSGNGSANQVTYYTGTSTLSSSSNFTFNGTNVGIGGIATPETRLDVNGGIQTRFASIDPNTANGWVYVGPMNTLLSGKFGSAIGGITAYNATLDKSAGELVLQGRSDAQASSSNIGITLVTGGNTGSPAPRYSINFSGQHRFHNLNGTGNRLPVLDANGVMTRSSYDPALFLTGVTGSSSITVSGSAPSPTVAVSTGGVGATELASTAVTAGTYGSATQVGQFTVDADGRITAASNVSITGDNSSIAAGNGLTLSGSAPSITLSAGGTLSSAITWTTGDQTVIFTKASNTGTTTPVAIQVNNSGGNRVALDLRGTGGTSQGQIEITEEGQTTIRSVSAGYVNIDGGTRLFRFADAGNIELPEASGYSTNEGFLHYKATKLWYGDGFASREIAAYDKHIKGGYGTVTTTTTWSSNMLGTVIDANAGAFTVSIGTDLIEGVEYRIRCERNGTNAITFSAVNSCNFHIDGDSTQTRTSFTAGASGTGYEAPYLIYRFTRWGTDIFVDL